MDEIGADPFKGHLQYHAEEYIADCYASDLQDPVPTKLVGKVSRSACLDVFAQSG